MARGPYTVASGPLARTAISGRLEKNPQRSPVKPVLGTRVEEDPLFFKGLPVMAIAVPSIGRYWPAETPRGPFVRLAGCFFFTQSAREGPAELSARPERAPTSVGPSPAASLGSIATLVHAQDRL